jgi:putative transposase
MATAEKLSKTVGTAPACDALAVPRATLYRHRVRVGPLVNRPRQRPHRALTPPEHQAVLDQLHSERFSDKAPAQMYATLLEERIYHCSIRTMYRILAAHAEVRERRNQLRHPKYKKPELLAEAPNQVWSWDITKFKGPVKWTYFYLYVILDIFSRYVVGWMVATRESAALAKQLITETSEKQQIDPDQLTIHSDRGPSMKSKSVALLLSDLGVVKSHSRPHVSNDNPYSEAQFKTLKYCPEFPGRFGSLWDAREFCRRFFEYYNTEHHHSGIGLMTPEAVHYGRAHQIQGIRQETLLQAFAAHPERFVRKPPEPPALPSAAWINPPREKTTHELGSETTIATPVDTCIPLNEEQTKPSEIANEIIFTRAASSRREVLH